MVRVNNVVEAADVCCLIYHYCV